MAKQIELKIVEKISIKPSSPTPNHLRKLELSFLDQFSPPTYSNVLLFYTNDSANTNAEICHRLKSSLTDALTRFYPLAGQVKDNRVIECNDHGAEFVEARVNCSLSDALNHPDAKLVKLFQPFEDVRYADDMLKVQVSFFICGGMAISVCLNHKLADLASLSTFLKGWVSKDPLTIVPDFNAGSIFPPKDFTVPLQMLESNKDKFVTKRFVFDGPKIAILRDIIESKISIKPTRVEAVSSLIWKTAISTSKSSSSSAWTMAVNFRKRVTPPLSDYSMGNFNNIFMAQNDDKDAPLHCLVEKLRKGITEFTENDCVKKLQGEDGFLVFCNRCREVIDIALSDEIEYYMCSSWCRFSLYDVDFGWGKPKWVAATFVDSLNAILLMDTEDGNGVEAWVVLKEEHMALFELDHDLLSFASPNPSVIII